MSKPEIITDSIRAMPSPFEATVDGPVVYAHELAEPTKSEIEPLSGKPE